VIARSISKILELVLERTRVTSSAGETFSLDCEVDTGTTDDCSIMKVRLV